jgi:hypothetical protein
MQLSKVIAITAIQRALVYEVFLENSIAVDNPSFSNWIFSLAGIVCVIPG